MLGFRRLLSVSLSPGAPKTNRPVDPTFGTKKFVRQVRTLATQIPVLILRRRVVSLEEAVQGLRVHGLTSEKALCPAPQYLFFQHPKLGLACMLKCMTLYSQLTYLGRMCVHVCV